jgi:putative nucleotidyltransferase with HDIG domain
MDSTTFFQRLDGIPDIPTLPVVALKVNRMLQDYDVSIDKLSKTMEKDQAIVSKILKLVNSAFYGFRSKTISSLSHAVIMLGFNAVRNATLSVSVINAFSGKKTFEGFDITDFWRHSVAVAVTGRYLAEQTRLEPSENCFVAGLLHDIGKVVLSQYFQELFGQVLASVQENGLSFYETEKRILPVNHAQIGAHLTRKWQLPVILVDAIGYHHTIAESASNLNLLRITHVADIIVNNFKGDSETAPNFSNVHPEAAKIMKPQLDNVSEWFPEVATDIESACAFFLDDLGPTHPKDPSTCNPHSPGLQQSQHG